jgi:hypothetical protein
VLTRHIPRHADIFDGSDGCIWANVGERRPESLKAPPGITENMARHLKIEGASEYTGVPVPTLRWYRATHQGPKSYIVAGRVVYDIADLDAWLDEQKAQSVRGGAA